MNLENKLKIENDLKNKQDIENEDKQKIKMPKNEDDDFRIHKKTKMMTTPKRKMTPEKKTTQRTKRPLKQKKIKKNWD